LVFYLLASVFDDAAPLKSEDRIVTEAVACASQDAALAGPLVASVGSTIADMSQNSPISSASTDFDSVKQQPLTDDLSSHSTTPVKLEKPKSLDLKSLFAYSAQIQRKPTPPPVASSQQRRLSLPPIDQSKAISVDDIFDMADEEEEPSGFNSSKDSTGFDTQLLEDDKNNAAPSRRPSLDSVLTGGLENKENSRTAASNAFSRFAFGSSGSKTGSPATAPSTPTVKPKKRKSPSPSQANSSTKETLAAFARKKQKTSEDTSVPALRSSPLSSTEPFVIPDSDEEF
jgi:hypothetical protein